MAFDLHIPENSRRGQVIQMIVDQRQITPEQVLEQIVDEGLKATLQSTPPAAEAKSRRSYASFFGVAKGRPGAHGSPEAANRYLEELRSEW